MQVHSATTRAALQIFCVGAETATAKATLGANKTGNVLVPGVGTLFFGYELNFAVIYNVATIEADLAAGSVAATGGALIYQGEGNDWEGVAVPTQLGVRALLIEDVGGGTGARQVTVETTTPAVISIPHGGHLLLVAPQGKLLDSEWHTLIFKTDTATQQAMVKVTALTEYGD